jgi:hypothetical protein
MKIDFEFQTKYGVFRDALHLPDDHTFNETELNFLKKERLDNWISILEAPPIEPQTPIQNNSIEILGEIYEKLETVPPPNAKLVQVDNIWYYKV